MEIFKVPYGRSNEDVLIPVSDAIRGERYRCPSCDLLLVLRDGQERVKHFSHPPNSECSEESIIHITAKELIAQAISNNASGSGKGIRLRNGCFGCGSEFYTVLPNQIFDEAKIEMKIQSFICDVVAIKDGAPKLAIEIYATHEIDYKKANELKPHWIELRAEDVIDDPYEWKPTKHKLKSCYCHDCKERFKHIVETCRKWGVDENDYIPIGMKGNANYIAATETCFKCKERIPVFWWKGVPFCEKEPPIPRPKTIIYKYSKQFGGSYWANTCPNCKVIQGDNHLLLFESGVFFGLPLVTENIPDHGQSNSAVSMFSRIIGKNIGWD